MLQNSQRRHAKTTPRTTPQAGRLDAGVIRQNSDESALIGLSQDSQRSFLLAKTNISRDIGIIRKPSTTSACRTPALPKPLLNNRYIHMTKLVINWESPPAESPRFAEA